MYIISGIVNTLRGKNNIHAFGNNSAESEPIRMRSGILWAKCGGLTLADFGRGSRRSDSLRGVVFPKKRKKCSQNFRVLRPGLLPLRQRWSSWKFVYNTYGSLQRYMYVTWSISYCNDACTKLFSWKCSSGWHAISLRYSYNSWQHFKWQRASRGSLGNSGTSYCYF